VKESACLHKTNNFSCTWYAFYACLCVLCMWVRKAAGICLVYMCVCVHFSFHMFLLNITYAYILSVIYIYIHIYICIYIHTYIHRYTYIHTFI
jgi:hypothetical protein